MDFASSPRRLQRQVHYPKLRFGFGVRSRSREILTLRCRARQSKGPVRLGPEGVRFELTRPFGLPVFKTGAFNRSATPPRKSRSRELCHDADVEQTSRVVAADVLISRSASVDSTSGYVHANIFSCARATRRNSSQLSRKRHKVVRRSMVGALPGVRRIALKRCMSILPMSMLSTLILK